MRNKWVMALVLAVLVLGQGCVSKRGQRAQMKDSRARDSQTAALTKKSKTHARHSDTFALMDESTKVDMEIMRRGNRARGLSDY